MTEFTNDTLFAIILSSWIVFALGIFIEIYLFGRRKDMAVSTKILIFSGVLFVSITLLRYATSAYINTLLISGGMSGELLEALGENAVSMSKYEHLVRSIVQALRTFAIDEDYYLFTLAAESMKDNVLSAYSWLPVVYKTHAAIVTILAPVAGGAIVFDILTRVFPKMKLRFFPAWREFYVFSELNDSSLALAQSIKEEYKNSKAERRKQIKLLKKGSPLDKDIKINFPEVKSDKKTRCKRERVRIKRKKRPAIVFTDVYIDRENEAISERVFSAKALGAICLADDIYHIRVRGFIRKWLGTKINYLLMDEKEENNLHTLSMLAEHKKGKKLMGVSVYLFTNSSSANDIVRGINIKLKSQCKSKRAKLPVIRVIEGYKNLVYNLLRDVPLYEPLIGRVMKEGETAKDLNVTIIGSGIIGTQMFLATYWMGQMLDVKLHINVVSQEAEESFADRINLINADILKTESHNPDSELLKIYTASDKIADPYFTLRYVQADVMTGTLYEALNKKFHNEKFALCDSDYFVVAIGSDENNILVANKIRQFIGRDLLTDRTNRRAVINYVVYDKDVCETLNASSDKNGIYMNAFGNFRDVYNYENVFMSKTYSTAVELNKSYVRKSLADKNYGKREMTKFVEDEYGYWSSIARGLHIPYKYFSAGVVTKSKVFDNAKAVTEDPEVFNKYLRLICLEMTSDEDNLPSIQQREEMYYRLTWLEHRRWNAFIRTGGFTLPSKKQLDTYAFRNGNKTKELSLRLHPCLVECDDQRPKIPAMANAPDVISTEVCLELSCIKAQNFDRLDAVSLYLHRISQCRAGKSGCIYKAYDSPYELRAENKSLLVQ